MASTATAGADKKAIEEPVNAVPEDEMSALSTTEIPVTDPVALQEQQHTDAAGDAQNEDLRVGEFHASDGDSLDNLATLMSPSIQSTVGAASGRNVAVVAAVIVAVDAVGPIIQWIKDQNWDNQRRRSEFTRVIVRDLSRNDPRFNYVICRTRHEVRFDGQPDVDFTRRQVSMPIRWGFRGITYDLYAFRSGAFCLLGDGGYLDWARYGIIASDSRGRQPRTIVFSNPV